MKSISSHLLSFILCILSFALAAAQGAGEKYREGYEEGVGVWFGGAYGGGPGRFERIAEGGLHFVRLTKVVGPGATQMQMRKPADIGAASKVRVTFRHRGVEVAAHWRLFRRNEKGAYSEVKNQANGSLGEYLTFRGSNDWTKSEIVAVIPKMHCNPANAFTVKFDVWGKNNPVHVDIDDVVIETLEAAPLPAIPPPVKVNVTLSPKLDDFGPLEILDHPKPTIKNGLLLRGDKPFFWVGNGCDYGSSQSTSVGLGMAKLLGYTAITLDPQGFVVQKKQDGTNVTLIANCHNAGISHYRETARLGFYADFFGNSVYEWSPLKPLSEKQPDFHEVHYAHGHYIAYDTGTDLGLEIMSARREAYFRYVADVPGVAEVELCREPGPEPANNRAKAGFRKWAERKYGTLAQACKTWRRKYDRWDDVIPLHLVESDVSGYMARILQLRMAKAQYPEMHYDWLQYAQDDYTECVRREREEMRKRLPSLPVTIDVRGHGGETDNYVALDPERIDPMMDLFSIHFGASALVYNQTPYHLPALLEQTSFALFSYNFFRTNTEKPIFNSEDIIMNARVPGSDGEVMMANDIGALQQMPWKFRFEEKGEDGLAGKWYAKNFDDSAWDEMKVPGCWDETDKYKCKSGVAWYRKRFIAKANRLDWEDGSHKFYLYGKGIAQSGTIWLNGECVGKVVGWDSKYQLDVSALLNYGGENELAIRVDGNGFQNGLRFYCHILPQDKISKSVRFGAKQYRWMLWPYLMHGTIGCWVWSWHDDYTRPYFPSLVKKLEVASEIVLPDLRHRRGKVAYLYGFLSGRGLPCAITRNHEPYLNWYNAIEFSGVRPDVFGERHFVKEINPERYQLLVVPYTKYVSDETYAAFKRYVNAGGTAMVTDDSMIKTFDAWKDTDIREFAGIDRAQGALAVIARGKGRVIYVPEKPPMEKLMEIVKPYLPEATVEVTSSEKRELPLIERVFAGSDTRKILYLCNWGGFDHPLEVKLPAGCENWRMTSLEGKFERNSKGYYTVKVPSQDVAVLLLEHPSQKSTPNIEIPKKWQSAIDRVAALNSGKDTGRPKVLFPMFKENVDPVGKELYPYVLDRIDHFGAEAISEYIDEWTPEMLSKCAMVVLPETNTKPFYRQKPEGWAKFRRLLREYVENGGSLMVMVHTAWEINNYANLLSSFTPEFGMSKIYKEGRSARHCAFGDPAQVIGDAVAESPIAEGVKNVQLYLVSPIALKAKGSARPAVRIPADAEQAAGEVAMATAEIGKGRVFVSADAMAFQPFRIGCADNAALLENVVGWLLGKPVTQAMRDEFKHNLFIDDALRERK